MLRLIQLLSLLTTVVIPIGITLALIQPTTTVGPHQAAISQSTTLVLLAGVFLTAEPFVTMVSGPWLSAHHPLSKMNHYTAAPIKA